MGNAELHAAGRHRPGPPRTLAVLLALALSGCAGTRTAADIQAELAQLRAEQLRLIGEVAALRAAVGQLTGAPVVPDQAPAVGEQPAEALPAVGSGADAEIAAVLDAYRQALEAEDIQRVRDEVYGGILPADDLEYLKIWFDRVDQLQVSMAPRALNVHDGSADAVVRQTMNYRLSRTSERRRVELDLRMAFQRRGTSWHVTDVQPRR
ncbi:MAG: hypothetical protein JSU87_15765 [Gemmatimonadota bacterium]|nr:MAG: hypothetical protein JSU87_15765 [Gemmatimonadota bacterium]